MDKQLIKQELLKKEKQHIALSTKDYHDFLNETKLNRNEVTDLDDRSHQVQSANYSESLDKNLHEHESHLATLKSLSFEPSTIVEPGAIVSVNGRCLIIAVSKPSFTIGERNFIGISTDAPIYAELKGKKEGDSFRLNGQQFTIEAVH